MQRDLLRYGITGFWVAGAQPAPRVEQKAVMSAAHSAARQAGRTVGRATWAEHCSFHEISIARGQSASAVLFNASYPLIAFAALRDEGETRLEFVDDEPLAAAFNALSPFRALSVAELKRPFGPEDLASLNEAECQQVTYWQPATVGDLVFNFWD